ncbi:hypothetical protein ONZ45_g9367 [Pleurotus djamor]|nr:hypothetical protein ONZ45_g9367 [Pleurotus djamor]
MALTTLTPSEPDAPRLSRMVLDYLTIPATSVAVERVFSTGRLALSLICNRLSAQSTQAILCLGEWSRLDIKHPDLQLIRSTDLRSIAKLPEVDVADPHAIVGDYLMDDGWGEIH